MFELTQNELLIAVLIFKQQNDLRIQGFKFISQSFFKDQVVIAQWQLATGEVPGSNSGNGDN